MCSLISRAMSLLLPERNTSIKVRCSCTIDAIGLPSVERPKIIVIWRASISHMSHSTALPEKLHRVR